MQYCSENWEGKAGKDLTILGSIDAFSSRVDKTIFE